METKQKPLIICTKCGRKYHEEDLLVRKVESRNGWRRAEVCPHCCTDYYLMDVEEGCGQQPKVMK